MHFLKILPTDLQNFRKTLLLSTISVFHLATGEDDRKYMGVRTMTITKICELGGQVFSTEC